MTSRFTSVEQTIDDFAHRVLARLEGGWLPSAVIEFVVFGIKQAWACLFGGLMLAMIMASALFYPEDAVLNRYDALFLGALIIQLGMIAFRLETFDEVKVILVFHVVGTAMEIFKTSVGSWVYPEQAIFRIVDVPMFSGFMYAAVGSYLARVTRIFDFRFTHYPPVWATVVLAGLVYVNFFAHHYLPDIRLGLFAVVLVLFGRTRVYFRVFRFRFWMPLVIGFGLVALFIWFAENIGTLSRAWLYPNQANGWSLVSIQKLGSWYLLMIISFVLVTLVRRPQQMTPDLESKNVYRSEDGT
ncbi:hypothetical protein BN1012_Phect746 [Candidatus Phaeomarinobacter ectocarpi]|uniref:DUF817 domain-containing protein n=1 Tax=Candidatus Phaeomarinibacter ectocarpi TaxID=1458461 RepID=X5MKX1_9HYPH|nr:DUF817 domain-containing protein [Candidatus Phaeomarinobacter ectocarpi]CDO58960.1 hypothetical protein BN1012_Phect746 [Candidatus Phaeomarinobacter ectocarpi]